MDFTNTHNHTASLVYFSPGASFILTAFQDGLVVRRADSLQITRTWECHFDTPPSQTAKLETRPQKTTNPSGSNVGWITHAGWSCDSEYLLAACAKKGVVNVFKLRDESWSARIDAGAEGLAKAEWAPDGRSIVCFSEWGLRVTVWSLITGTAVHIQYPLHPDRGYAFRRDGRYFVLAERHKSKDTVGVYDTTNEYRLVRHYPVPTNTLASLSLSPAGSHLAIWEGPLEYKVCILSLAGDLLGTFSPDPDRGFGVRTVIWHPSGAFLLTAGWDDKIHVLESLTWGPISVLELQSRIPAGVTIWREPSGWVETTEGRGFLSYERLQAPYVLSISRPDLSKPYPKSGAVQLAFNVSGTLLLARFDSAPTAVFLYAFPSPSEYEAGAVSTLMPKLKNVLIHSQPVLSAQWNPVRKGSLAICCGGGGIYLWSDEWVSEDTNQIEEIAECVGVPAGEHNVLESVDYSTRTEFFRPESFQVKDVRWAPDGKGLVLLDKDAFCCAFEVENQELAE